MTTFLPPRRLIPRWRRTAATLSLAEASFSPTGRDSSFALSRAQLAISVNEWRDTPTVGHLGDVLAYSVDRNLKDEIADVAREALDRSLPLTRTQRAIISDLLGEDKVISDWDPSLGICNPATKREVANLRCILRINPANPLALLDLAQFQLSSGDSRKAERSILSALNISPNNRIILRTLARLYVHTRMPDKAHSILRRHQRTPNDPWLMAAEIALAEMADTSPYFASRGQRMVRDGQVRYADLSELAGALGGLELGNGKIKRARDMFRVALRAPNDNVIAQVITHQRLLGFDLSQPEQRRVTLSATEAQTLLAWQALDTDQAEQSALAWHDEEPFSSRPLQFLTTLYAVQKKYDLGMNLARRGLIADPKDPTLLSNLSYLLANSGQLDRAEKVLRRLSGLASSRYDGVVLATTGLIAMKRGHFDFGDELYMEAVSRFKNRGELMMETNCLAYYARSAIETSHPSRNEILKRAMDAYQQAGSADAAIILRQLEQEVEPMSGGDLRRRLSQWVLDEKNNTLIRHHGVTKEGAPTLIIKPK